MVCIAATPSLSLPVVPPTRRHASTLLLLLCCCLLLAAYYWLLLLAAECCCCYWLILAAASYSLPCSVYWYHRWHQACSSVANFPCPLACSNQPTTARWRRRPSPMAARRWCPQGRRAARPAIVVTARTRVAAVVVAAAAAAAPLATTPACWLPSPTASSPSPSRCLTRPRCRHTSA